MLPSHGEGALGLAVECDGALGPEQKNRSNNTVRSRNKNTIGSALGKRLK
jgi:hypothetical protein